MSFLELLEQEQNALIESEYSDIVDYLTEEESLPADTLDMLKEAFELDGEDLELVEQFLGEALTRRVSARGDITRVLDKKTRSRRAVKTTGLSRMQLKMRARKSAKTRKRTGVERKNIKKRRKANRIRKQRGIK